MTYLQCKGLTFKWTSDCQNKFEWLKKLLTTACVLKVVDSNKEFELCTDACQEGVVAVLTQDGQVIAYESWKIK